jgi:hypothetical protein
MLALRFVQPAKPLRGVSAEFRLPFLFSGIPMIYKVWIYHSEHEPKIVNSDEAEKLYSEGWEDSPAKCKGFLEKVQVNEEDVLSVQAVGTITENIKDAANLEINIETLDRKELIEFAEKRFGEDWSKKRGVEKMRKLAERNLNGDSE